MENNINDIVLVREVKEGNEDAFRKLVERYKDTAFSLAYNIIGHYEDARDISQDAFARAYFNIKGFREESSFKTWFFTIIINLCRSHMRRKKVLGFLTRHRGVSERESDSIQSTDEDIEGKLIIKEQRQSIMDTIKKLPSRQREVFIMRHNENMKISEIAKILNCAEGTVKAHLFRAVSTLKELLMDKE